ncbi:hypothetical protein ACLESD_48265 [Pyxidicoccus sp. 3LFB2]
MSHGHTLRSPKQRTRLTLSGLSLGFALLAGAGCGAPESEDAEQQPPPLASSEAALSSGTLGCYVDTPAYDYPTAGGCFGLTNSRTAKKSIAFDMINPVPGNTYQWSGVTCAWTGPTYCVIQVSPGVYTATVTIRNSSGTVVSTQSATAELEYEPGW